MGVGQLSESDAVDALRLPFYSSSHPTGSHGWRNQFDLGNTSQNGHGIRGLYLPLKSYLFTVTTRGGVGGAIHRWKIVAPI